MKVFVTGASGFIGSAVVSELLAAGHQVIGLARSDSSAEAIAAMGAEVHRGSLEDLDSLRSGASQADGVIHTAFIHDFSDYARAAATDKHAIEVFGAVLAGSNRPLLVTSGLAGLRTGRPTTELDDALLDIPRFSEHAALPLADNGVCVSVLRHPPSVHGKGDHGFVPTLIKIAREKGVSAYPGDGMNRWPAVHRLDSARLFLLALENVRAGSRFHAIADEGVAVRDIAEVIGRHLSLPVESIPADEAGKYFGWLGTFFSMDVPATSTLTQQQLGWHPTQPGLLEDLEQGHYFNTEV